MEPVPILTVGDLKFELSRWSDGTPVTSIRRSENRNLDFTDADRAIAYSCLRSMNFRKHRRWRS